VKDYPTVVMYHGRRIDDLTRDELIQALTEAAEEINRLYEQILNRLH
jgi:hypothetical protein